MISLPIPEVKAPAQAPTYDSILHEGETYDDLMKRLGYSRHVGVAAHVDPDLVKGLSKRPKNWRAMFGQVGQAESHLARKGFAEGSLFLFWGWFEHEEGRGRFCKRKGFSSIYGYLEVGKVIRVGYDRVPREASYHPHFNENYPRSNNRVYVARKRLTFNSEKPGWGIFRYHPRLRLSPLGENRSVWSLPSCFNPQSGCDLSYLGKATWLAGEKTTTVQIPGRGQEFVTELRGGVRKWVHHLINKTEIWTP